MWMLVAALFNNKIIQEPFSGWMDKQTVIHSDNGILLRDERHTLLMHTITWVNLRDIMLSERSQSQRLYPLRFHYMTFPKCGYKGGEWFSGWHGLQVKEWYDCKGTALGRFGSDGTILYPDRDKCTHVLKLIGQHSPPKNSHWLYGNFKNKIKQLWIKWQLTYSGLNTRAREEFWTGNWSVV